MTEAQTWTLIVGSLSATFAVLGIVMTSFTRTMRAEFASVRSEMRGEFGSVRAEIDGLNTGIRGEITGIRGEITGIRGELDGVRAEMRSGFARVDDRLDHLDRDVQALTKHIFERPE